MRHLSRRLFLHETLLAAAVTGTAPVLATETTRQSTSPNERLRVAVLGVNGRGSDHANAFNARKDCVVSSICDADAAIGARAAARYPSKPRFVQDMRRIFDDKSVDIVSIATPNHWHALAAIWAMQAGKDVYVEKPVSHNISEGRRLVQAARRYNRICQGGTQHRSNGANRAAAQYVRADKLGRITLAHVCVYGFAARLDQQAGTPRRHPWTTTSGPDRHPWKCRSGGNRSTTTGTGSGTGAAASWPITASTPWTPCA